MSGGPCYKEVNYCILISMFAKSLVVFTYLPKICKYNWVLNKFDFPANQLPFF